MPVLRSNYSAQAVVAPHIIPAHIPTLTKFPSEGRHHPCPENAQLPRQGLPPLPSLQKIHNFARRALRSSLMVCIKGFCPLNCFAELVKKLVLDISLRSSVWDPVEGTAESGQHPEMLPFLA